MTLIEAQNEYYRLVNALGIGSPDWSAMREVPRELRLAAKALGRIGERECNGVIGPDGFAKWNEDDQAKADRERARYEKRIRDALERVFDVETFNRLNIEFQNDPRGPAVYIHIKNGPQRVATFW